MSTKTIFSWAC